jgi:hypothetical protein
MRTTGTEMLLLVPAILLHLYIAYRIRPSAIPR